MRKTSLAFAAALAILLAPTALWAGTLDQRVAEVGQKVEAADDMFTSAMKGHLPSLAVINALRARMTLAEALYADAMTELAGGKENDAGARLDAAEFLAGQVFEASEH